MWTLPGIYDKIQGMAFKQIPEHTELGNIFMKHYIIFFIITISLLPIQATTDDMDSYIRQELDFLFKGENLIKPPPVATTSYPANKWGTYSAQSAFDNKIETSWVEGADGPGIGEKILFIIPEGTKGFQILPGYGTKSVFTINNRVKKISIRIYYAKYDWQASWEESITYLEYIKSIHYTFRDKMELQEISIDENLSIKSKHHTHIFGLLEILSVYKGRDDDTCIAEIRFTHKDSDTMIPAKKGVEAESLVGVWQDSPMMASGWGDTYLFFKNITFIFYYNQMDCAKRDLSFSGTWKIFGNKLILEIKEKTHVAGGRYEQAGASCASEKILVGGDIVSSKVVPVDRRSYTISEIVIDDNYGIEYPNIEIGGERYWQFSSDPDYYKPNYYFGQTRP